MFSKEDVESWNELFPDCKIKDSDLLKPSELFLTKILIAYLRSFGYKVNPTFSLSSEAIENTREKRLFLIKLSRHIDHILKITDKSYAFLYYDLIRPAPKKTSNMLGILLNYLYYFNMFRTDVFNMANERLKCRQELISNINETEKEHDNRRHRSAKIKEDIEELNNKIISSKTKLDALIVQKDEKFEYAQKLQNTVKDLSLKLQELENLHRNLKKRIVSDPEAHDLQLQKVKLQENIAENKLLESSTEKTLMERKEDINILHNMIKNIEAAQEIIPPTLLEKFIESHKALHALEIEAKATNNQKIEIVEAIKKLECSVGALQLRCDARILELKHEKLQKMQTITEKEESCKNKTKLLDDLGHSAKKLDLMIEEQKTISTYLSENIRELQATFYVRYN